MRKESRDAFNNAVDALLNQAHLLQDMDWDRRKLYFDALRRNAIFFHSHSPDENENTDLTAASYYATLEKVRSTLNAYQLETFCRLASSYIFISNGKVGAKQKQLFKKARKRFRDIVVKVRQNQADSVTSKHNASFRDNIECLIDKLVTNDLIEQHVASDSQYEDNETQYVDIMALQFVQTNLIVHIFKLLETYISGLYKGMEHELLTEWQTVIDTQAKKDLDKLSGDLSSIIAAFSKPEQEDKSKTFRSLRQRINNELSKHGLKATEPKDIPKSPTDISFCTIPNKERLYDDLRAVIERKETKKQKGT